MIDTDSWSTIKARHYTKVYSKIRYVRVIVIHSMEAPELDKTAENVAKYFQTTTTPASAHACIDNNSIIQCVRDNDIAYAAPGCNHDGIQLELAGYARQTISEWLDDYSKKLLDNAAEVAGQYCLKYSIPAEHLTNSQLLKGQKGIVGHYQVSQVYKKSSHSDPGIHFPWEYFINLTRLKARERAKKLNISLSSLYTNNH